MSSSTIRKALTGAVCALAAGLLSAPDAGAAVPTGAHPATGQIFSITAPAGRYNQIYSYDLFTGVGNMGLVKQGSTSNSPYAVRSSYDVTAPFSNYVGVFIYDYAVASWSEVYYICDGSAWSQVQ